MGFLSAAFLLGLAGVSVPVLIHLIHRQRYPERAFTTLRFFDKTVKHNTIQRKLVDRILLALRILALCALALGLARPFTSIAGLGEQRLSLVVVIDNSPSMGRVSDGKTLFERAKASAQALVAGLQPADRAEIVLTAPVTEPRFTTDRAELARELEHRSGTPMALLVQGEGGAELSLPRLTTDIEALRAAIAKLPAAAPAALCGYQDRVDARLGYDRDRLAALLASATLSAMPGDTRAALATAGALLSASHDCDRHVVVYTDLQRDEWSALEHAPVPSLAGIGVSVAALTPMAAGPNLAIDWCVPDERDASLGNSITGTALLHNYGAADSGPLTLTVNAGDRGPDSEIKLAGIPAGASLRTGFPLRIMGRGRNLLCRATLTCALDTFAYDNTWYFQVGMRPPITALCLSGVAGVGADRSTFYMINALSPRAGANQAQSLVEPIDRDLAALGDEQLFKYAVVVLVGAATLDGSQREKLRQFVEDGGGLLVFPGATATPEEYNAWGFLPARVVGAEKQSFTHVKTIAARMPAVSDLKERASAAASGLSCDTWLKLQVPASADAAPLAWFADGSPALVEGRLGRGRVILSAAGCHLSDSDWPLRPAFPLLVRGLVRHLGAPIAEATVAPERGIGDAAATLVPQELRAGATASFMVADGGGFTPTAYLRTGDALVLPPTRGAGQYLMASRPGNGGRPLAEPGLGATIAPVSVNHAPSESDLQALAPERVAPLLPGAKVEALDADKRPAEALASMHTGGELWRWLLIAALAVLTIETLVAWRSASDSV